MVSGLLGFTAAKAKVMKEGMAGSMGGCSVWNVLAMHK